MYKMLEVSSVSISVTDKMLAVPDLFDSGVLESNISLLQSTSACAQL